MNTQIFLNPEGGEGIEYTQESDHPARISSSPSSTHGRQVDELSVSEVLSEVFQRDPKQTVRKPHSNSGLLVRWDECGQRTPEIPSSQGIHLCTSHKMPVISNLETELDLNSTLLFAVFHAWQDWNIFHLFCSVVSTNTAGAIPPYSEPIYISIPSGALSVDIKELELPTVPLVEQTSSLCVCQVKLPYQGSCVHSVFRLYITQHLQSLLFAFLTGRSSTSPLCMLLAIW